MADQNTATAPRYQNIKATLRGAPASEHALRLNDRTRDTEQRFVTDLTTTFKSTPRGRDEGNRKGIREIAGRNAIDLLEVLLENGGLELATDDSEQRWIYEAACSLVDAARRNAPEAA